MYICEPEQEEILIEDYESIDDEERPDECLIKWLESAKIKYKEMMPKVLEEKAKSHYFEPKCLSINVGCAKDENEQQIEAIKKEEEGARVFQINTKENRSRSIVTKEEKSKVMSYSWGSTSGLQ